MAMIVMMAGTVIREMVILSVAVLEGRKHQEKAKSEAHPKQ